MQATVSQFIQKSTESSGTEISSNDIWDIFSKEFINRDERLQLTKLKTELSDEGVVSCDLHINYEGKELNFKSIGNGPIDASKKALSTLFPSITIESYSEHSLSEGSDSKAICYLTVLFGDDVFMGLALIPILHSRLLKH